MIFSEPGEALKALSMPAGDDMNDPGGSGFR
jgi:hypothetical protein